MSNVIRGGQNLLHYFRMFDQVVRSLFFAALATVFLVGGYLLSQKITLYDLKVYGVYVVAKLYVGMGVKNVTISIANASGITHHYKVFEIATNNQVIKIYHYINEQIFINLFYGVKSAIYVVVFTILAFGIKGWMLARKKTLRGKNIVPSTTLQRQILAYNLKRFCFLPIKIAGIPYPKDHEKTHTLITGASGTGKTVAISDLIDQVRKKGQKAIIYDKMGVYVERFYDPKKDILLNPLDIRSANWNLLKECDKSSTLDTIAKAFIPAAKSNDPFWDNAARIVFSETLNYLRKKGKTGNQSLQDVYFGSDQTEFNHIIKSSGILSKILAKDNDRTTGSILSVMISYVRCLKHLSSDNNSQNFSLKNWIEDDTKDGFLFISSSANQHETLKPLISVFFELAINNLLSLKQNQNRRIWLFLDELPSLHYLPSLQSGLAESRQFGGSFILSLQLMAQLRSIYGKDLAESVSGLCRNRVVFSTPDEETANWCSGSLGKIEVEEIKENFSYGASQMRDGVNLNKVQQIKVLVLPTEIMGQKDLNCYVSFSGFPLTQSKLEYKKYPQISERFVEREEMEEIEGEALEVDIEENLENENEAEDELVEENDFSDIPEPDLNDEELENDEDSNQITTEQEPKTKKNNNFF